MNVIRPNDQRPIKTLIVIELGTNGPRIHMYQVQSIFINNQPKLTLKKINRILIRPEEPFLSNPQTRDTGGGGNNNPQSHNNDAGFSAKIISPHYITEIIVSLNKKIKEMIQSYNAIDVHKIIFATAGYRKSVNGNHAFGLLKYNLSCLAGKVLSGQEEMALACKASTLSHGVYTGGFCDLGGGSFEYGSVKKGQLIEKTNDDLFDGLILSGSYNKGILDLVNMRPSQLAEFFDEMSTLMRPAIADSRKLVMVGSMPRRLAHYLYFSLQNMYDVQPANDTEIAARINFADPSTRQKIEKLGRGKIDQDALDISNTLRTNSQDYAKKLRIVATLVLKLVEDHNLSQFSVASHGIVDVLSRKYIQRIEEQSLKNNAQRLSHKVPHVAV